jgi:hypothetical protein
VASHRIILKRFDLIDMVSEASLVHALKVFYKLDAVVEMDLPNDNWLITTDSMPAKAKLFGIPWREGH